MDTLTSWKLGLAPDQMREMDRLAEAEYGIAPVQLMEVAGLQVARLARQVLGADLRGRQVCVLTGKGNNGGDGLVAARRLDGWGAMVRVLTSYEPSDAGGLSLGHLAAARAAGIEVQVFAGTVGVADLFIDALLGFGSTGAPRGAVAEMITALRASPPQVLAVDLPSGLDAASGDAPGACIRAGTTVTLALPKTGMLVPSARGYVGDLYVADIGIPPTLLRRLGVDPGGLFEDQDLHRLG